MIWKTVCVKDGKTYFITSEIEEQSDGMYIADGKTNGNKKCLIRWFFPYPVDVNNPADWEIADEIIMLSSD